MQTRHGIRVPVTVKLLMTALSAAFVVTLASAFSWHSVPLADAATAPVHPPHVTVTQSGPDPYPANPFKVAASILHAKHLHHIAVKEAEARAAAARAWAKAHPPTPPAPPVTHTAAPSTHVAAPVPPPSYSGGVLTSVQVGHLWLEAGGPAWAEPKAVEIAYCESGFNPRAYNPSGATGIWQILGAVVPGNLTDPLVNAENAVAKFKGAGGTFAAWVCQ